MARRKQVQPIAWVVVQIALRSRRKITDSDAIEAKQTEDGSQFFLCSDHPRGARVLRFWPQK